MLQRLVEGEEACRDRIRWIEKLRKLGGRVSPTRPTPQQSPRDQERGGGIERWASLPVGELPYAAWHRAVRIVHLMNTLIIPRKVFQRPVAVTKLVLKIDPELKAEVFRAARETRQSASRFTREALRAELARVRRRNKAAASRDDRR